MKRAEPREVHSVADKSHLMPSAAAAAAAVAAGSAASGAVGGASAVSSCPDALARRLRQTLIPPSLQHLITVQPQQHANQTPITPTAGKNF